MTAPEPSPYQLLGVSPEATIPEIVRAYQRAVRARQHPASVLTQAFNQLRSPRQRLQHDVLAYRPPAGVEAVREVFADLEAGTFLPERPIVPPAVEPPDPIEPGDLAGEWRQIPDGPPPPAGERFPGDAAVLPPLELPL